MKAVLASIRPQHCINIANNIKSVEVRKTRPKLDTPFKVYIYCTAGKPYMVYNDDSWCTGYAALNNYSEKRAKEVWELMNGKVIGEFVCDSIFEIDKNYEVHTELPDCPTEFWLEWDDAPDEYETTEAIEKATCLSIGEICLYIGSGYGCYCWHISNLVIYDEPKPLSDFKQCHKCPYGGYENCKQHEYSCDGDYKLTKPPQSWCYVEEMERGAGNG